MGFENVQIGIIDFNENIPSFEQQDIANFKSIKTLSIMMLNSRVFEYLLTTKKI